MANAIAHSRPLKRISERACLGDSVGSTNYVAKALDEAIEGKPVTMATSKPYGCSVKYKD